MSTLSGVTASIGGSELFAGGCFTGTVTITGAAVGMVVSVTPRTYPGSGITWQGFVSAPNTVTVKVCSAIAANVEASLYDVQVSDAATPPSGVITDVTGTLPIVVSPGVPVSVRNVAVNLATSIAAGVVQPDGTTISVSGGVISTVSPIVLKTATVTLTEAQIRGMVASPVQIIPAQGAGTLIVPVSCILNAVFGSAPFTGGSGIGLAYPGVFAATTCSSSASGTLLTTFAANQSAALVGSHSASIPSSVAVNAPVNVGNSISPFAGGTGCSLIVTCVYYVLSGVQ